MIRSILTAVVLVLTLAAAAPAQAALEDNDLAAVLPIARSAWPDSPCAGHEVISYDEAQLRADHPDPLVAAEGYQDGSCRVVLGGRPWQYQPDFLCDVVTHEFGHLAGWGHIDVTGIPLSNPLAEMSASGGHWTGCDIKNIYSYDQQIVRTMRQLAPGKRWTCSPRWKRWHKTCHTIGKLNRVSLRFRIDTDDYVRSVRVPQRTFDSDQ